MVENLTGCTASIHRRSQSYPTALLRTTSCWYWLFVWISLVGPMQFRSGEQVIRLIEHGRAVKLQDQRIPLLSWNNHVCFPALQQVSSLFKDKMIHSVWLSHCKDLRGGQFGFLQTRHGYAIHTIGSYYTLLVFNGYHKIKWNNAVK